MRMSGMGMSMGGGLFGGESLPVIEAVLGFAGQRQTVLLNNIANWSTPNFRAQDLPEKGFQRALAEALRTRGPSARPIRFAAGFGIRSDRVGGFQMVPVDVQSGAVRPDGNTVVIDEEQTKLLKNGLTVQVFSRLLSMKFRMLRTAISERLV
jgi:flagellar basal-body rod protein FlgB